MVEQVTDREIAEGLAGTHGDLCGFRSKMRGGTCTCEVEKRTTAIEAALQKAREEGACGCNFTPGNIDSACERHQRLFRLWEKEKDAAVAQARTEGRREGIEAVLHAAQCNALNRRGAGFIYADEIRALLAEPVPVSRED